MRLILVLWSLILSSCVDSVSVTSCRTQCQSQLPLSVLSWHSQLPHGASGPLKLLIGDSGQFVEPRKLPAVGSMSHERYQIVIEFSREIKPSSLSTSSVATLRGWYRSNGLIYPIEQDQLNLQFELNSGRNQLLIGLELPGTETVLSLELSPLLQDQEGRPIENMNLTRRWGVLMGDLTQDGKVSVADVNYRHDDLRTILAFVNFGEIFRSDEPVHVRADVDRDAAFSDLDSDLVLAQDGMRIDNLPPIEGF